VRFGKHVVSKISMWSPWADKTFLGAALFATLFLAGASGFAQVPAPHPRYGEYPRFSPATDEFGERRNAFNNRRIKPFKIVGNLYYVGFNDVSSLLIVTPQGHILIDSTFETTWPLVMESIEELGFQVRDIKYLLHSHGHIAHISAHRTVKDLTGAQIWAAQGDAMTIEDGGLAANGRVRWKPAKVDNKFQNGAKLTLGGTTLTAHITPCETEGATTWTMVAEEDGRRYNVVMSPGLRIGRINRWPTKARDCEMGLRRAAALPADIYLSIHAPYYGLLEKVAKMKAMSPGNPFINPEEYRSYVAAMQKDLQDAVAKERAGQGR